MNQQSKTQRTASDGTEADLTVNITNQGCASPHTLGTPGAGNPLQPGSTVKFINLSPTNTYKVTDLDTANTNGQNAPLSDKSEITLGPNNPPGNPDAWEIVTIDSNASGTYMYTTPSCPGPPEMIVGG